MCLDSLDPVFAHNVHVPSTHLVDLLVDTMSIEPYRLSRCHGGFHWSPGLGLTQIIHVDPPRCMDGVPSAMVTISTPVFYLLDKAAFEAVTPLLDDLRTHCHGAAVRTLRRNVRNVLLGTRVPIDLTSAERATDGAWMVAGLAAVQARHAWAVRSAAAPLLGAKSAKAIPDGDTTRQATRASVVLDLPEATAPLHGRAGAVYDAIVEALDVGNACRLVDRGDDHAWFVVDVGPRGGLAMVSVMEAQVTGPSVAVTLVVDTHLSPSDAAHEARLLQAEGFAYGSPLCTLGSWVSRPHFDGAPGLALLGSTFFPASIFGPEVASRVSGIVATNVRRLQRRYGRRTTRSHPVVSTYAS